MSLFLSLPFGRYKVQFSSRHLSLCLSGVHRRRAKRRECFDEQVTSRGSVFSTFRSRSRRRDSNMQRRCADVFVCTWCLYLMCVCVCVLWTDPWPDRYVNPVLFKCCLTYPYLQTHPNPPSHTTIHTLRDICISL